MEGLKASSDSICVCICAGEVAFDDDTNFRPLFPSFAARIKSISFGSFLDDSFLVDTKIITCYGTPFTFTKSCRLDLFRHLTTEALKRRMVGL